MAGGPFIPHDARCACGYNLRSLPFDHRCPECGKFAYESVRLRLKFTFPPGLDGARARNEHQAKMRAAAAGAPYEPLAFPLVLHAMRFARVHLLDVEGHVTARDVCRGLREMSKLLWGGPKPAVFQLAKLGIRRSEDVGEIVFRLCDAGLMRSSPQDDINQFAGLFTLENLYTVEL